MDYIEREKVMQLVRDACSECKDCCEEFDGLIPDCNECIMGGLKVKIPQLPIVHIVPCEDCEYGKKDTWHGGTPCVVCENLDAFDYCKPHDADWFCADGERIKE